MTRKDYVIIAKAINEIRASVNANSTMSACDGAKMSALDDLTINMAAHLREDNPAFDLARFKQAAGM